MSRRGVVICNLEERQKQRELERINAEQERIELERIELERIRAEKEHIEQQRELLRIEKEKAISLVDSKINDFILDHTKKEANLEVKAKDLEIQNYKHTIDELQVSLTELKELYLSLNKKYTDLVENKDLEVREAKSRVKNMMLKDFQGIVSEAADRKNTIRKLSEVGQECKKKDSILKSKSSKKKDTVIKKKKKLTTKILRSIN